MPFNNKAKNLHVENMISIRGSEFFHEVKDNLLIIALINSTLSNPEEQIIPKEVT